MRAVHNHGTPNSFRIESDDLIPYAQFRYGDLIYTVDEDPFLEWVNKGHKCKCGECLYCRATEYYAETSAQTGTSQNG